MAEPEGKVALLAGASGLAGSHLLGALLAAAEFTRVYAVTRRPLGREHARLANRIIPFDRLEAQLKGLVCHTAFCCLGASSRDAGSEREARRVDFDYVLAFARAAKAARAQRFVFLSCMGADSDSRSPSLRAKHDAEAALEALGFGALDILQPGPLLGVRREMSVPELARTLTALIATPFLFGPREARRGIAARSVAAAMLGAARSGRRGVYRYTYSAIQALADTTVRVRPARASATRPSKAGQPSRKDLF
ncbi:MAG TPA: NAD-dependent epimerase/dehydratase family protein [Steroidobacteraceae bacterium]|nr:NAD-dependent epimerase/dehydratase family protein [Steroidobacteraceae bacterium]